MTWLEFPLALQVSRANHISAASGVAYTETRGATTLSNWTDVGPKALRRSLGVASAPSGIADVSLPTAKDLIAKNNEVMGGAEAWSRTATRTMKGLYQTEDSSTFFS